MLRGAREILQGVGHVLVELLRASVGHGFSFVPYVAAFVDSSSIIGNELMPGEALVVVCVEVAVSVMEDSTPQGH